MSKNIIGLIGAMDEEITPILIYMKKNNYKYEKISYGNNIYYKINFRDKIVYLCKSKIGKVFASMTTTILIEKFKCNLILFTGVAGAINNELNIGDMVIAEKLCQHDFDITSFGHPHGHIPENNLFIETSINLNNIAKKIAIENNINIKYGIIATGDQFISSIEKKKWINSIFSADAIEMEGGAVAQVCSNLNIDFLILRSISDDLNGNEKSFDEFMKESAMKSARFMILILNEL